MVSKVLIKETFDKWLHKISNPLNESVSSIVYNFTSLPNAVSILNSNKYLLQSSIGGGDADNYGGRMFYLSTTRNKSTKMGYGNKYDSMRHGSEVRFELNGDLLNQNFKGLPIDYWGASMGKQSYYSDLHPYLSDRQHHSSFEMEDRVVSNKPYINNFKKYINRIDILMVYEEPIHDSDKEQMKRDLSYIQEVMRMFGSKVFLYDNTKDFNYQTDKCTDYSGFFEKYGLQDNPPMTRKKTYSIYNLLSHFFYCYYAFYKPPKNYFKKGLVDDNRNDIAVWLRKYGLEEYISQVMKDTKKVWGWDSFNIVSSEIKNLSFEPSEDGQKAIHLISDMLQKEGFDSWRKFARYNKEVADRKNGTVPSADTEKKIQFVCIVSKEDPTRIESCVLPNDSYWELTERVFGRHYRNDFVNMIMRKYYNEEFYHRSKDDESFEKYLQHLTKNDISCAKMLEILGNLGIKKTDNDLYQDYYMVINKNLSYFELPYFAYDKYNELYNLPITDYSHH